MIEKNIKDDIILNSMTGFGRANIERDGRKISIELKSVNHRYLDLNIRLPRALSHTEEIVRKKLKGTLSRGHVDVFIYYKNTRQDAKQVAVDAGLASAYSDALKEIKSITGAKNDITTSTIARMNDVLIISEGDEDEEVLSSLINEALSVALSGLCDMRKREGASLKSDMLGNIDLLENMLQKVEERAPVVPNVYREKLMARFDELLKDTNINLDEQRLMAEVAVYCDKCSIAEEISRLKSHLYEFRQKSEKEEPIGRSMDFLVQEMNRETNTICSKANDIDITNTGLTMKNAVEKIREQVQNVE